MTAMTPGMIVALSSSLATCSARDIQRSPSHSGERSEDIKARKAKKKAERQAKKKNRNLRRR